jgi:hypothetical protein
MRVSGTAKHVFGNNHLMTEDGFSSFHICLIKLGTKLVSFTPGPIPKYSKVLRFQEVGENNVLDYSRVFSAPLINGFPPPHA